MVKNLCLHCRGCVGSIPGQGTKSPHATLLQAKKIMIILPLARDIDSRGHKESDTTERLN